MVTMEKDAAAQNARLYRQLIQDPERTHTAADEAALRAYRQLAKDEGALGIVSLRAVIERGGQHENGMPRLAVARADTERVYAEVGWDGGVHFADTQWRVRNARSLRMVGTAGLHLQFPAGTLEAPPKRLTVRGETLVPLIPPQYRPKKLRTHHVLFEVDEWRAVAPVDPALLKHLGGDLWAVLAVWDLTEVERLALSL